MNLDEIIEEQIVAHYKQLGGHIHCDGERGAFPAIPKRIHDTIVAICRNVVASLDHQGESEAKLRGRVTVFGEIIGYGIGAKEGSAEVEIEIPESWMIEPPEWLVEEARCSRRLKTLEERNERAVKVLRGREP